MAEHPGQFSMGTSSEAFAPTGPAVVTLDELADPERLAITATIVGRDGERIRVQDGNTDQLVFSVASLVSRLSATLELLPGGLVFTGTPPGVGAGREPKRFLSVGETQMTEIEGLGVITQRFVAREATSAGDG